MIQLRPTTLNFNIFGGIRTNSFWIMDLEDQSHPVYSYLARFGLIPTTVRARLWENIFYFQKIEDEFEISKPWVAHYFRSKDGESLNLSRDSTKSTNVQDCKFQA